jgi:hypothetical protein
MELLRKFHRPPGFWNAYDSSIQVEVDMVGTFHSSSKSSVVLWGMFAIVAVVVVVIATYATAYTAIVLTALGTFVLSGHAWFHASAHAGYVFVARAALSIAVWATISWWLLRGMWRRMRK